MERTIVIGLGGTGVAVCGHVKKLLGSIIPNFDAKKCPISLLAIDFDQATVDSSGLGKDETWVRDGLREIEATMEAFSRDKKFADSVNPWFRRQDIALQFKAGAQQARAFGRLLAFRNSDDLHRRIGSVLQVRDHTTFRPMPPAGSKTNVIVVGSTCGGTGSGTLLDVAAWVRKALPDARIAGFVTTQRAFSGFDFRQRSVRNYYLFIKELLGVRGQGAVNLGLNFEYTPVGPAAYRLGVDPNKATFPIDNLFFFDPALGKQAGVTEVTAGTMFEYMALSVVGWSLTAGTAEGSGLLGQQSDPKVGGGGQPDTLAGAVGASLLLIPDDSEVREYLRSRIRSEVLPQCSLPTLKIDYDNDGLEKLEVALGIDKPVAGPGRASQIQNVFMGRFAGTAHPHDDKEWKSFSAAIAAFLLDRWPAGEKMPPTPNLLGDALVDAFTALDGTGKAAHVLSIGFPIRGTCEEAFAQDLEETIRRLFHVGIDTATTLAGSVAAEKIAAILGGALAETRAKYLGRAGGALQRALQDGLRQVLERFTREYEHGNLIKRDIYVNVIRDVQSTVGTSLASWAAARRLQYLCNRLVEVVEKAEKASAEKNAFLSMAVKVDGAATSELFALCEKRGWARFQRATDAKTPVINLLALTDVCEDIYKRWRASNIPAGEDRGVLDAIERWAMSEGQHAIRVSRESAEEWLSEASRAFVDAKVPESAGFASTFSSIIQGTEVVHDVLAWGLNQASLDQAIRVVFAQKAFLFSDDQALLDRASAVTNRQLDRALGPTNVETVLEPIVFGGRRGILLVYYLTNESVLNLPGIVDAQDIATKGGGENLPAELFSLDKRWVGVQGLPEMELVLTQDVKHECGFSLGSLRKKRDETLVCPNPACANPPVTNWCGRMSCNFVSPTGAEMKNGDPCPGCSQKPLAIWFACRKHQGVKWFRKDAGDYCPDCVAEGNPHPTSWKDEGLVRECWGCVAQGRVSPMRFQGPILHLLDGLDDDEEIATARQYERDQRYLVSGDCPACNSPILPYCPWGSADPKDPNSRHFVRRNAKSPGNGKVHMCLTLHVDGNGASVPTGVVYTCGSCAYPVLAPAPGASIKCPRCGKSNYACGFHNSPFYGEKKDGAEAYRLVALDNAPAADDLCPVCNKGLGDPAPVLTPPVPPKLATPPQPMPLQKKKGLKWECTDDHCHWTAAEQEPCPVCGKVEKVQQVLAPAAP